MIHFHTQSPSGQRWDIISIIVTITLQLFPTRNLLTSFMNLFQFNFPFSIHSSVSLIRRSVWSNKSVVLKSCYTVTFSILFCCSKRWAALSVCHNGRALVMMLQRCTLCLCVQSAQSVCMVDISPWGLFKQTSDTKLMAGSFDVTGKLKLMGSLH